MAPTKKAPAAKRPTPVRRSVQKSTSSTSESRNMLRSSASEQPDRSSMTMNPRRSKYFIPLLIVLIAALLYINKNLFIVAMVNNAPITRLSVIRELEKQSGKQALDGLISQKLLSQEAKAKNVTVSKEEVDARLKEIDAELKAQGQSLEQFLEFQGTSMSQVREQVELQLIVEKVFADKIAVTKEEVNEFYEQNKENMPEATNEATAKKQIEEDLRNQKLSQEVQKFLEEKRSKANIRYFMTY